MFSGPVCGEKWTSCQRLGDGLEEVDIVSGGVQVCVFFGYLWNVSCCLLLIEHIISLLMLLFWNHIEEDHSG